MHFIVFRNTWGKNHLTYLQVLLSEFQEWENHLFFLFLKSLGDILKIFLNVRLK